MAGVALMASQIGGALAPLLVVPIQIRFGWRASFYVFGALGICWAIAWYGWFRDSPDQQNSTAEPQQQTARERIGAFPWRLALRSGSVTALMGTAFCYVYVYNFFQTWFHTFLVKGRGFNELGLLLSALPYVVAVFANLAGGAVSDALVRKLGRRRGRSTVGVAALSTAGLFTLAAMLSPQQVLTVVFLAIVYGAITFQQSAVFGVCLDIGQRHAGAMVGLMNTASQVGGLVGSVAYGYIVERFASFNAPFVPMAALLFLGALLWFRIDASEKLHDASESIVGEVLTGK
jgi:predicted MFS family arabinose efflux permease